MFSHYLEVHVNKTTEINKKNSLYHPYLPDSVERKVTLIEYKGAIYRGLITNSI